LVLLAPFFLTVCLPPSVAAAPVAATTGSAPPRWIGQISASRSQIAFAFAGDIWVVPRAGGEAHRITSGPAEDTDPCFSPDGSQIAFTRALGRVGDVFRVAATGGDPIRLTYHPALDTARGWSPDGRRILFSSMRGARWERHLYTVPINGGRSDRVPIPVATAGVFSPDGREIVYQPLPALAGGYSNAWRNYRGGFTTNLEIANLGNNTVAPITPQDASDRSPSFAGTTLVFASDRDGGVFNLFALDANRRARRLTAFDDFSVGALSGTPDGKVVFVRDGRIFELDPQDGQVQSLNLKIDPDLAERNPRDVPVAPWITSVDATSSGAAVVAARGDIFVRDAKGGHWSNITQSSDADDRSPVLSPNGDQIAFASDMGGGDDALYLRSVAGGELKRIALPTDRGSYDSLLWDPPGRHLVATDMRGALWLIDAKAGSVTKIDQRELISQSGFHPSWSRDGRRLVYVKQAANGNNRLMLHDVTTKHSIPLTDATVDARAPVFDTSGRYLLFSTSSNSGLAESFGMYLAIYGPVVSRELRAFALYPGSNSPFTAAPDRRPSDAVAEIEPALLARRAFTAAIGKRNVDDIIPLRDGSILLTLREWSSPVEVDPVTVLYRLTPGQDALTKVAAKIDYVVSYSDGSGIVYTDGDEWWSLVVGAAEAKPLDLASVKLQVDPAKEWQLLYRNALRTAMTRFYDPAFHGQDMVGIAAHYAAFVPGITRRADLNALMLTAIGHLSVSHVEVSQGDLPATPKSSDQPALLGADFIIDQGKYRISRLYRPSILAGDVTADANPFDTAGINVAEGEYLLAVNGQSLSGSDDLDRPLADRKAGPVQLTIAANPTGASARTVTVSPLRSDTALRDFVWIDRNRAYVEAQSNGRAGYIYIPDFQLTGIRDFVRQLAAASEKEALVLDQRWNGGGWPADLLLDLLRRRTLSYYKFRDAKDMRFPPFAVEGPKVLLVNQRNSSAAETFAFWFRKSGLGKLVGQRTAGAGVGHYYSDLLQDGGRVSIPMRAFFAPEGSWTIENRGVVPDIAVAQSPVEIQNGRDPQLETAVALVLRDKATVRPTPQVTPAPVDLGCPAARN
jgi:tricorn protease